MLYGSYYSISFNMPSWYLVYPLYMIFLSQVSGIHIGSTCLWEGNHIQRRSIWSFFQHAKLPTRWSCACFPCGQQDKSIECRLSNASTSLTIKLQKEVTCFLNDVAQQGCSAPFAKHYWDLQSIWSLWYHFYAFGLGEGEAFNDPLWQGPRLL